MQKGKKKKKEKNGRKKKKKKKERCTARGPTAKLAAARGRLGGARAMENNKRG